MGAQVTQLLLYHEEFRSQINGPTAAIALPTLLPLFRSKQGIRGLLEFYTGAPPPNGTRVREVPSLTAWKDAIVEAGDRPVVAFFHSGSDLGSRILSPMFNRLPDAEEYAGVDFLRIVVRKDDGLALQVLDEAFVGVQQMPCFVFMQGCIELKEWRYQGADISELCRRLKRIALGDRLDDGPG